MSCDVCGAAQRTAFRKEQNVSCGDYFEGKRLYPENLGDEELRECTRCGFGCFAHMQTWPMERFRDTIYNNEYALCDRPFKTERPAKLAAWLGSVLPPCRLLDYGGGEGTLAKYLNERGFQAASYDPFYGDTNRPLYEAGVVTAFEVVEHVPDQRSLFTALKLFCSADGLIIFSTLLKAPQLHTGDWWYASARNGHVSFHTAESLARLTAECGLELRSLSREIHVAARHEAALEMADGWPVVAVNDVPPYEFAGGWTAMAPVLAP